MGKTDRRLFCSAQWPRYLHSNGIFHNDIKPENILVQQKMTPVGSILQLKYCDFGFSHCAEWKIQNGEKDEYVGCMSKYSAKILLENIGGLQKKDLLNLLEGCTGIQNIHLDRYPVRGSSRKRTDAVVVMANDVAADAVMKKLKEKKGEDWVIHEKVYEFRSVGSPAYVPDPSILTGLDFQCRRDQYALGCTLYACAYGHFLYYTPERIVAQEAFESPSHPYGQRCTSEVAVRLIADKAPTSHMVVQKLTDLAKVDRNNVILTIESNSVGLPVITASVGTTDNGRLFMMNLTRCCSRKMMHRNFLV